MATALFAGSFNPYTLGHHDIVTRALGIFDRVIVAVGHNIAKPGDKDSAIQRRDAIAAIYAGNPRIEVVCYDGLTTDAAKQLGATHLLRGVRSVRDFEYERDLADTNRILTGIDTVLLPARPDLAWLSSSTLRELSLHGRDISQYLPPTPSNN